MSQEAAEPPGEADGVDLRRGFGRAGTTLFWSSAAVVMALWAAQRIGLVSLGPALSAVAFALLFLGFSASTAARAAGLMLHNLARSKLAGDSAAAAAHRLSQLPMLPRLVLGMLPGPELRTLADLTASCRDGRLAEQMRALFQTLAAMLGSCVMGAGAAAAAWQWWQGAGLATLQPWLVVVAIGAGLMGLLMAASGWVAEGFRPLRL